MNDRTPTRFPLALLAMALLCSGCSMNSASAPRTVFHFGPVNETLSALPEPVLEPAAQASRAARLREALLAPVNRYAPSDKDWRFARSADKGPTIAGIGLRFSLQTDEWQFRAGVQRRGSTRMFGPVVTMTFNDDGQK